MADVEEPPYEVIEQDGEIEIRRYPPLVVAEVTRSGSRRSSANEGFRALANYIFGGNLPEEKIAMTAPVTQLPAEGDRKRDGEKIAMTAPVTQLPATGGAWRVRFIMPQEYTLETLPKPKDPGVRLIEEPARTVAAIRFSGVPGTDKLERKTAELRDYMNREGLKAGGDQTYAFYNPPWTLPFMRRNEVIIPLAE